MYPAPIQEYHRPKTVEEAVKIFKSSPGETAYIAGGMSIMQAIKSRFVRPDCLVDLNDVSTLREMEIDGDSYRLGAMMRYCDVVEQAERLGPYRIFSDAAAHVGDRQVRHRGTIGGSICWNYVAACTPVAALAAGAELEVHRARGWRRRTTISIDDFLTSPMENALRPGDILTAIRVPKINGRAGSAYKKWGIVKDSLPVVGVGAMVHLDEHGLCTKARVAYGGLANGSERAPSTETYLDGKSLISEDVISEAAKVASEEAPVQDDPWINAAYRKKLVFELAKEVLKSAVDQAQGDKP
jgi:carbon-monoxide dehydrogenase medium subunit